MWFMLLFDDVIQVLWCCVWGPIVMCLRCMLCMMLFPVAILFSVLMLFPVMCFLLLCCFLFWCCFLSCVSCCYVVSCLDVVSCHVFPVVVSCFDVVSCSVVSCCFLMWCCCMCLSRDMPSECVVFLGQCGGSRVVWRRGGGGCSLKRWQYGSPLQKIQMHALARKNMHIQTHLHTHTHTDT